MTKDVRGSLILRVLWTDGSVINRVLSCIECKFLLTPFRTCATSGLDFYAVDESSQMIQKSKH